LRSGNAKVAKWQQLYNFPPFPVESAKRKTVAYIRAYAQELAKRKTGKSNNGMLRFFPASTGPIHFPS